MFPSTFLAVSQSPLNAVDCFGMLYFVQTLLNIALGGYLLDFPETLHH
jgi:hypothetical protein